MMKLAFSGTVVVSLLAFVLAASSCGDSGSDATGAGAGGSSAEPPKLEEPVCADTDYQAPLRPAPVSAPTRPPLHVSGRDLLDDNGTPVSLRGVNFGSWLMSEAWFSGMGPYVNEDVYLDAAFAKADELGVKPRLTQAFGTVAIAWLNRSRGRWVLFQEMRSPMYDGLPDGERKGVDAFWSWVDNEPWVFEEESLWRHLESLHGAEAADELRRLFADSFITELDVERVAALGLTLIRVPFWYGALEDEPKGGSVAPRAAGWKALDDLVDWARKHGVYLLLDLHGAPGGQSAYWHQGLRNGGYLWKKDACVTRTAHLWRQLALHFQGEAHIAAFGLLNEPDPRGDRSAYERVHQALYQAVRSGDPDRIVLIEDGYQGADKISSPKEMGWSNAMFSIHAYPGGDDATAYEANIRTEVAAWKPHWERFDCPLFLGEFSAADPGGGVADLNGNRSVFAGEAMARATKALSELGVHWAPWIWKSYTPKSYWGLYNPPEERRFDLRGTDLTTLKDQFSSTRSDPFVVHQDYADALTQSGAMPTVTLSFP